MSHLDNDRRPHPGKAVVAQAFFALRARHPEVPALLVWRYMTEAEGESFKEFICARTTGHSFSYTGTAYGGDDPSYHGEGRCLCAYCGADGDA